MNNNHGENDSLQPLPERLAHLGLPPEEFFQFIETIKTRFPDKNYCAVQNWIWVDFDFAADDRYPSLSGTYVWAGHVVIDEAGRFETGNWVRTSPLVKLHDNSIFETKNTIYILIGPGQYWYRTNKYDN